MKIAFRLLRAFCPSHLLEEIEGDLIQKFERDVKLVGERKAKRKLLWNVIRFFRPGIVLRNKLSHQLNSMMMLQNYLKITLRNLNRRRAYSLINVLGLAVGVTICLVISKYVEFETSFDSFHSNRKSIFRVVSSFYTDGAIEPYCGNDLAPALLSDMPEIKRFARTHGNSSIINHTDKTGKNIRFYVNNILVVDSSFLEIFTFKFIYGNTKALYGPYAIVLTKSVAQKYFGNENPIGKALRLSDNWLDGNYTVSAVIDDMPENTHFNFEVLMPMHNVFKTEMFANGNNARFENFHAYIEVYDQANLSNLQSKIPAFIKKYRGDDKAINLKSELQFQPLADIHYSPDLNRPGGHRVKIYFFVVVAVFILVIAWINYINLATARAMERAREVGVKKALGVMRSQLIFQFLFESVLVNFVSVSLAVVFAWLALPILNSVVDHSFVFDFTEPRFWAVLVILFITGSLAAGFYPAFVLSSFKTTEVIKGKITRTSSGLSLRNGLVVFQFASSLLLIVGTFVVYRQLSFLKAQEKNFKTDQVVIMKGPEMVEQKELAARMISLKNELKQIPDVEKVSASFSIPLGEASFSTGMRKLGNPIEDNRVGNIYWVDPDFMDLYQIKLLAGKFWNEHIASEMKQIVVNEEAVKVFQLGSIEEALNEKIVVLGDTFSILGVVKNHHWNSLKRSLAPMLFRVEKVSSGAISIQVTGIDPSTLGRLKEKFLTIFPGETFSYYFLQDKYNSQYKSEQQFGELFTVFSIVAVLIGCLGLWGLASFTTLHRLKEISIRKVLGASVNSILYLLSRQFLKPLLIGSLIAVPIGWIGMIKWLEQFPYRIQFTIDLFLIPLLLLILTALATISIQTIRAATTNPVTSLKSE